MKKRKPKTTPVQVRLDPDQIKIIDDLKGRLNVKGRSEVLRQGLPYLIRYLEAKAAGEQVDLEVSGDAATKEWKLKVIELTAEGFGITKCAQKVKRTRRTIHYALQNDPVFLEQFQDAKALCVEDVEHNLLKQAKKEKPNITAILAFLNAHHPDYGQIRKQVLHRVLGPFIDRIVKLAEEFVSPGLLPQFIARLGRDAERVALDATAGKG